MSKPYTTVQGDMWDSIAYAQLGSAAHTGKLMNANQKYRGIYIFPAGLVLNIPDAGVDDASDASLPWKRVAG